MTYQTPFLKGRVDYMTLLISLHECSHHELESVINIIIYYLTQSGEHYLCPCSLLVPEQLHFCV